MGVYVGLHVGSAISHGYCICEGDAMRTGDIKRIGRRNYCVLCVTDYEVTLQSLDEQKLIITIPRAKILGLKSGQ